MLSHDLLDGLGGFVGVVEGDGADVVVKHVGLYDAVEELSTDEAKFTIDGRGCSTDIVPGFWGVMREGWVGMLEESDCNQPVIYPQVWSEIPNSHVGESVSPGEEGENGDGDGKTEITQKNEFGILGFKQRARWVEVVDTSRIAVLLSYSSSLRLLLVMIMTSDIGDQIQRPAEKLLSNGMDDGSDWSLLSQLVNLVNELVNSSSVDLAGLGDKDHVTLHVTGGLVVLSMGDLPREVRDQKCRMTEPASCIIENLGWRERLVTALVC